MAVSSFSNSGIRSGVKRNKFWDQSAVENSFFSIDTQTVGSGGASYIEFTNIPQTYTHLQIRGIAKSTTNTQIDLTLNGDTANNYSHHQLGGTGSTVFDDSSSTQPKIYAIIPGPSSSETTGFSAGVIDILDYANTNKYKTVRSIAGWDGNGAGSLLLTSGNWRSTDAITTIRLTSRTYNFVQYTSFALYGIKG